MRIRSAYTLLETLCVVAMIAILAAISVPNFLEAQVRTKVARAQTDLASIAAALRAYSADFGTYPPNRPDVRRFLLDWADKDSTAVEPPPAPPSFGGEGFPRRKIPGRFPVLDASGWDLVPLTTPVAYFSRILPTDVFRTGDYPYLYVNAAEVWSLVALTSPTLAAAPLSTQTLLGVPAPRRSLLLCFGPNKNMDAPHPLRGPFILYDPTNGTRSEGELLRIDGR